MSDIEPENIYHGNVPVVLKHPDREDRSSTLTVQMSYTVGQPRNQKVLHIQLTDEADAFLLYTLDISEDDFHALKTEQSILVDFPTFPSKFVELLKHCQSAAGEDHPRFVAVLSTLGGAPVLTVTETNPFRQLAHLALRFVSGNDAAIKKYLAGRVADFKAQLALTRDELGERTAQLQETAELAAGQTEKLRTIEEDHVRALHELDVKQQSQLASAKEAAVAAQQEMSRLADQERSRVVERSETELSTTRQSLTRVQSELGQLTSAHHELELKLREKTSRLQGAEEEVTLLKKETTSLREESSRLSTSKHKLEKERDVELAAARQSVQDKEALLAKMTSLHEAASDGKRHLDETLSVFKDNNAKLQEKLKASAAEITRGNAIIQKLQADNRGLKGQLKLKATVMLQQQEHTSAKQSELEHSERGMAELRALNAELRAEKERGGGRARAQARARRVAGAHALQQAGHRLAQPRAQRGADGREACVNLPSRVASFTPVLHPSLKPAPRTAPLASTPGRTARRS